MRILSSYEAKASNLVKPRTSVIFYLWAPVLGQGGCENRSSLSPVKVKKKKLR